MAARLVGVCEAVKDFLNGESFSQPFTAVRKNTYSWQVEDTSSIQVVVLPGEVETLVMDRRSAERKFQVMVVIAKKLSSSDNLTAQDELLMLAEEMEDAFYSQQMDGYAFESFSATTGTRVPIDQEASLSSRLFRTVIELTYRGV